MNPFHEIKTGVSDQFKQRINKIVDEYDKTL
jgi:hypothetical protein